MTCLLSTSPSALSVCCELAGEKADRKAAEAGVAFWLLPRKNPEEGGWDGCPVPMGVATCLAPLAGPMGERCMGRVWREVWKPQPRAEPGGRGEGYEAQAAHQEDMPADNRQPVVLSYCPSN